MGLPDKITFYSPFEEKLNILSHGVGVILSVIGLVLLVVKASTYGELYHILSVVVFGVSMIILYTASTLYHNAKSDKLRHRLNIFDHASIYVLIAGSYTPFTLVTLHGQTGWIIFIIVWTFALTGIILKLFFAGRYQTLSTILYVFMGWIILFAIKPMINNLSHEGLMWLLAGGISYTIGAVIFSIDRIKLNHAMFHIFVLLGTFCHFISILNHVLPQA